MSSSYEQFFKNAKKNSTSQTSEMNKSYSNKTSFKRKEKKAKRPFPAKQFSIFFACAITLFLAVENFDSLEGTLKKVEIGFMTTAEAQPAASSDETKAVVKPAAENPVAETAKSSADDSDYLFKLAERKKELDAREEELNKKAAEISKQKEEIEGKLVQLEEYRKQISEILKDRIAADSSKVDTLVQVYSNMKPIQAAKVFETMDEDLVIEILSRMKKKSAADILNLIKTEKAQVFAEKYAGYRMPAENKKETTTDNNKGGE